MNHLRELIDAMDARLYRIPGCAPVHSVGKETIKVSASEATCFYAGSLEDVIRMQWIPELCILPFNTIWIEGETLWGSEACIAGILVSQSNEETRLVGFVREPKTRRWAIGCIAEDVDLPTGVINCFADDRCSTNDKENCADFAAKCTRIVAAFCSALNCSNVSSELHLPDQKLQNSRQRRGKQPLFSYWTLRLGSSNSGTSAFSGSHASPRVHLRRGHPRQFAPGKWTWVQAHAVGNPKLGMVHKDYDAKPLTHRHHQSSEVTQ